MDAPSAPNSNLPKYLPNKSTDSNLGGFDDFLDDDPKIIFKNAIHNSHSNLETPTGLDEVSKIPIQLEKNIPYFEKNDKRLNIKYLNTEKNPEKVISLGQQKRIVFLGDDANKTAVGVNPIWDEQLKDIEEIAIEDKNGKVRILRNDGTEPGFIIKAQSRAQMIAIAIIVNQAAQRILEENNKDKNKEEDQLQTSTPTTDANQVDLKKLKAQKIDPRQNVVFAKMSKSALRFLHESAIRTERRKKDKHREELEEAIKLKQWIILKDVLRFNLQVDNINRDLLKTIILASEMLKSEYQKRLRKNFVSR